MLSVEEHLFLCCVVLLSRLIMYVCMFVCPCMVSNILQMCMTSSCILYVCMYNVMYNNIIPSK